MFSYICFVISIIILGISVAYALKNRTDMGKWITCVTLGILFSTFFMVLPTEWVKEGKSVWCEPLYVVASSVLYSLKAIAGRQDLAQIETIAFSGIVKWIYIVINYICFILCPILASGLILTFIGDLGDRIRYALTFRRQKCYVFSQLNENSLILARGIRKKHKNPTIIFCNTKNADKSLISGARKESAILLHKSCLELHLKKCFSGYEFFCLTENEDQNIQLTENFIAKKEKLAKYNIIINTFAQSSVNISVLEHLLDKTPAVIFDNLTKASLFKAEEIYRKNPKTQIIFANWKKSDNALLNDACKGGFALPRKPLSKIKLPAEAYNYNFTLMRSDGNDSFRKTNLKVYKNRLTTKWANDPLRVRFIDQTALFCNNLIFNHPLYDLPDGRRDISVTIVGAGQLGTRMLKTVVWAGQIEGYSLKINVYDNKAKQVEKEFYSECPELFGNYTINFIDTDILSPDFEKQVTENSDATFVLIATGSDDLNMQTAEKMFRIFRRANSFGYTPPIFTRIRKPLKSNNYDSKGSYLDDRKIYLFGTNANVFAEHALFNSTLENLALAVHLSYCGAFCSEGLNEFDYKSAKEAFYSEEYNRRSSMAAALHISAKLHSCQILKGKAPQKITGGRLPTDKELKAYCDMVADDQTRKIIMANEHERWNAFLRSEGYRVSSTDDMAKYMGANRSHKDEISKSHPCLVPWDKLDELQEKYEALANEHNIKPTNFKSSDEKLVAEIPQIIKKAKELCKEN